MKVLAALLLLITSGVLAAEDVAMQVLAEINQARTTPREYAELLETRLANYQGREGHKVVDEAVRYLKRATPLPALTFSEGLSRAALSHVLEQGPRGGHGHGNPWSRMDRFGQRGGYAGENIQYGARDARGIVMSLIVDDGVRGRGHRQNIFASNFRMVGVACGSHATYREMCVMDFASFFIERGQVAAAMRASATF
jgi:Cysteine-rich secretory protein family